MTHWRRPYQPRTLSDSTRRLLTVVVIGCALVPLALVGIPLFFRIVQFIGGMIQP